MEPHRVDMVIPIGLDLLEEDGAYVGIGCPLVGNSPKLLLRFFYQVSLLT